ncbi:dehydrodolichyl diphosphate synthase-like [Tropilaelaps mercedesae]|uniref:Alkyl transferase n=1 Tax=Tropilaelaps mercedesae TaxID=418985 RepID=A0A1V9XJ67_9ACAR|nr:dehydrodolichyl diphosphate synthase-like [Tropilaelaps mercedesae]
MLTGGNNMPVAGSASKNNPSRRNGISWLSRIAIRVLSVGHIPRHVALIMDGNRRYARKHHQPTTEVYSQGFDKLSEALFWCRQLGVHEVTVYAFSIENFRRTDKEVTSLLALAERTLRQLLADQTALEKDAVCFRILGNIAYLPVSLQQACAELTLATSHHRGQILNIALSYTAREEMCTAIEDLLTGADEGVICEEEFSEELLSAAMYSRHSIDPDLLVRTGETRLSNFLLWQTGATVIEFTSFLWPELGLWSFLGVIAAYQWQEIRIRNCVSRAGKKSPKLQAAANKSNVKISFETFIDRRRMLRLRDALLGRVIQRPWAEAVHDAQ